MRAVDIAMRAAVTVIAVSVVSYCWCRGAMMIAREFVREFVG